MGLIDTWNEFFGGGKEKGPGLTLLRAVKSHMPADADDANVKIVAAVTGLLGQVAFADRPYLPAEEERIRLELGKVQGLSAAGADAVCATLRASIAVVAEVEAHEYAKLLRELADDELKLHVLDLLLDVAAADDQVSVVEVNIIRRLTDVLGLRQADYNASQARHRDKLSVLHQKSE